MRAAPEARKVLVSYRRADSAALVGRIHDRLVERYGDGAVFLDIDDIPLATDFRTVLDDALRKTGVVLAVIGPHWRGLRESGARIFDGDDPVRVEIETALAAKVPIVPVLIDGAKMPAEGELPESLAALSYLNAAAVDSGRDFHHHLDGLIESLDDMLGLPHAPRRTGVRLWLGATATLLGVPVLGGAFGLAPPWPTGAGLVAGILAAVAFAMSGHRLIEANARMRARIVAAAATVAVLALAGYLAATALFVYTTPDGQRYIKGLTCTPEAQLLYKAKCPFLGTDELRGAEYEAERLWTIQSVGITRIALNALWIATFVGLGIVTAGTYARVVLSPRQRSRSR